MQRVELPPFFHKVCRQPPPSINRHLHHQAQENHDVKEERGNEDSRRGNSVVRGRLVVLVEKAAVGEAPPPLLPKDPENGDETDERGRRHNAYGQKTCQEGVLLSHVGVNVCACARYLQSPADAMGAPNIYASKTGGGCKSWPGAAPHCFASGAAVARSAGCEARPFVLEVCRVVCVCVRYSSLRAHQIQNLSKNPVSEISLSDPSSTARAANPSRRAHTH